MATSALPDVMDALVSLAEVNTDPHVIVLDGPGTSDDPGAKGFLFIGVDDPFSEDLITGNGGTQVAATLGPPRSRDDDLVVPCVAFSWNGDADQKAARRAAYAIFGDVESFIRADPWLGLIGQYKQVNAQVADHTLQQTQDGDGAKAFVLFNVSVKVRI